MSAALTALAVAPLAPLAVGWGTWLAATIAGAHRPGEPDGPAPGARIALLVPAHDEEAVLPALLASLAGAAGPATFAPVVVIADHCGDRTAEIARDAGAVVLERDSGPRGKPAALRDGLALVADEPEHDAVMIVDADCVLEPGVGASLSRALAAGEQVMQCAYRLSGDSRGISAVSRWAFALKNVVRPRGLARLGAPTQLFGTGMCFARGAAGRAEFRDHLTEDAALSYALVASGVRPAFLADAGVVSPEAPDREAMTAQRERWEGGQLRLVRELPTHLAAVLRRGDLRSLLGILDWSAPPLTAGIAVWLGTSAVIAALAAAGLVGIAAPAAAALTGGLLVAYLALGLRIAGGPGALGQTLAAAPRYLAWKAGVVRRIGRAGSATEWRRTPRAPSTGSERS